MKLSVQDLTTGTFDHPFRRAVGRENLIVWTGMVLSMSEGYTLMDESRVGTSPVCIEEMSEGEVDIVVECVDLLNKTDNVPSLFLAAVEDVKGSIFNLRRGDFEEFLWRLDELGMGYKVYDKGSGEQVFVANSEQRFKQIPQMEDGYESIEGTVEMGRFLGLNESRDRAWLKSDEELAELYSERGALDELVDVDLSSRELFDMYFSPVLFYPSEGGMERMVIYGRNIRTACERFDYASESMVGTLSLQTSWYYAGSFCTECPESVIGRYLRNRKTIGELNGWAYSELLAEEFESFRFSELIDWTVAV